MSLSHLLPVSLLAVVGFFTAAPVCGGPPEPTIKPEDEHTVATDGDTMVFTIRSERGIGRTAILAKDGIWPKKLVLRLHLKGLEKFEISNGEKTLITSVSSAGGPRGKTHLTEDPGAGRQELENLIPIEHPLSLTVTLVPEKGANPKIPLQGYFEIEVPAAFLKANPPKLNLHWIDFYRG